MSIPFTKQPGVIEAVWFSPEADSAAVVQKFKKGLAVLDKAKGKGYEGILYEGTIREEPGNSLRLVKWSSLEAHTKDFREGPLGDEYRKAVEGAYKDGRRVAHYQMYDPTPLDPKPECIETVTFRIKPDISFADFYQEWSPALKLVSAFDGCPYAALGQGIEDPQAVIQIQPWQTLDDHLIGFKQAPNVKDVMAKLTVTVEKYMDGGWKGMKGRHIMLTEPGEGVLKA